jgi:dTDP-glucose 4,6-dehydratase
MVVEQLCGILDELMPESPFAPHRSLMQYVADRPGHDRRYAIDIGKIYHDLGWSPRQSLGSGLKKTVEWYLSHAEWLSAIQQHHDFQNWVQRNYEQRGGTP